MRVARGTALATAASVPTSPSPPSPLMPSSFTMMTLTSSMSGVDGDHREVSVVVARGAAIDLGRLVERRRHAPDQAAHHLAFRGERVDDLVRGKRSHYARTADLPGPLVHADLHEFRAHRSHHLVAHLPRVPELMERKTVPGGGAVHRRRSLVDRRETSARQGNFLSS